MAYIRNELTMRNAAAALAAIALLCESFAKRPQREVRQSGAIATGP
jgi:hypothetical protein